MHAVLAGVPNHSFLSLQSLQGEVIDDGLDDDNNNNDIKENCEVKYNATVYDGRENTIAAVYPARLAASLSSANVAANIAPDLSTLSRNGLINCCCKEALRVQRSLDFEVAALQETMLSMRNQSQINSSAISGYQEGAFVVGKSLVEKEGSL